MVNSVDTFEKEELLLRQDKKLSLIAAIKQEAFFSLPFAGSRLILAAQALGYTFFIRYLNLPNLIAAAPVMFMVQQGFTGALRGALSTVNVIVGELNGRRELNRIGAAVNQALIAGAVLGVPVSLLFFFSADLLILLGMNSSVAETVGAFLKASSYGVVPANWAFVDQGFLLSTKKLMPAIMLNTALVAMALGGGIAASLTIGGVQWLGYASSLASALIFIIGRLYFLRQRAHYADYHLFQASLASGTSYKKIATLSFPTALQAISEWLPTMLISVLSGLLSNGDEILEEQEPSMQFLVIMNTLLLGLGTAATVSTANAIGAVKRKLATMDAPQLFAIQNVRMIGYANILLTLATVTLPAVVCLAYPQAIISAFSPDVTGSRFAQNALRLTGATLFADGVRNTVTGIVLGRKKGRDNFITSLSNLFVVSFLSVMSGFFLEKELGPTSYFLMRFVGIFLMALGLFPWWSKSFDIDGIEQNFQSVENKK